MATYSRCIFHDWAPLTITLAVIAAAVLAAGCSEQGSASQQADANAPVLIETSQTSIAVQNRAGLPLTDVSVTLVPSGGIEFGKTLPRIENSERREIPLGDFRSRDGSRYNFRSMRPKMVRLRASDVAGKRYEIEVPFN
jgi:hypothetical protein